jgi:hypothetical protein
LVWTALPIGTELRRIVVLGGGGGVNGAATLGNNDLRRKGLLATFWQKLTI